MMARKRVSDDGRMAMALNPFSLFRRRPLDLSGDPIALDPFTHYARLRRRGPVHWLPHHGVWIVLGYEDVKTAFEQPEVFSNKPYADIDSVLLAADPPDHRATRTLISRHFSAEALSRLTEVAEHSALRRLGGEIDGVKDYGRLISRDVGAAIIGWDDEVVAEIDRLDEETALPTLIATLDRLADRSTITTQLVADGGGAITPDEARSLVRLLWLAATTTTERVIGRGILRLLEEPRVRGALMADRSLMPAFVEEVTRLHPPEHMVPRLTRAAVRLGGVEIPSGSIVHLCVSAANRDPAIYSSPDELRLDRPVRRHFAFGAGIHSCVGAPLTRRVVAMALNTLLDRSPGFEAAEPLSGLDYFSTMTALSPRRLLIRT